MKITIDLTFEQLEQLAPMFQELRRLLLAGTHGAVLAQPDYTGKMIVALLNAEQTEAIRQITGMAQKNPHESEELERTRRLLKLSNTGDPP